MDVAKVCVSRANTHTVCPGYVVELVTFLVKVLLNKKHTYLPEANE